MPEYELTLETPQLSDSLEDTLVEMTDAVIAHHLGVHTTTLLVEAEGAFNAAERAINLVRSCGVEPSRFVDDLVTRTQIADRAEVTRQAVTNWVSKDRQVERSFPAPFILSGGGLWRWGEVLPFLHSIDLAIDETTLYPNRYEMIHIGMLLSVPASDNTAPFIPFCAPVRMVTRKQSNTIVPTPAPTVFQLAA